VVALQYGAAGRRWDVLLGSRAHVDARMRGPTAGGSRRAADLYRAVERGRRVCVERREALGVALCRLQHVRADGHELPVGGLTRAGTTRTQAQRDLVAGAPCVARPDEHVSCHLEQRRVVVQGGVAAAPEFGQGFTHEREGELDWHDGYETAPDEGYSTDVIAEKAASFIERRSGDGPFLCYVPFNAPHSPFQALESDIVDQVSRCTRGRSQTMNRVVVMDLVQVD